MADYYCPTVVEPDIPLADMTPLEHLLLSHMFDSEPTDEALYFYHEQSVEEMIWLDLGEVREALAGSQGIASRAAEIVTSALAKLVPDASELELDLDLSDDSWEDVFQDIVRRSGTISHVTVTKAFTCSKMRPDGFGGMVTVITADQVQSCSTHDMEREFLDRAEFGELACAPGHGSHIVLRLGEQEVRGTLVEIFETEASPGMAESDVTDDDVRAGCLAAIAARDLAHEHGELLIAAALHALRAVTERMQSRH